MYCSMSIEEFKNNLEKLTKSQLSVINYVKKAYKEKQLPFYHLLQGEQVLGRLSQQIF